ncbi:MAG: hypothetical protein J6M12_01060 [Clostridia bacterium]|nr:hypothetical protein [Clostridia bacterium]
MIGNSLLKKTLKRHPLLKENYRFIQCAQRAVKNPMLRKKSYQAFARTLAKDMEHYNEEENAKVFLSTILDESFSKSHPTDQLLHLCGDLLPLSLLLFLTHKKDESEDEGHDLHTALLLFEGYLKLDQQKLYLKYSSVHAILTQRDLFSYTQSDKQTQKAIRDTVYRYAKKHGISDSAAATTMDRSFLVGEERTKRRYFTALLVTIPLILTSVALICCGILPTVLLFFPILTLSFELIFAAAALSVPPTPLFKKRITTVEHPTLTVITTLLTSPSEIEQLISRLEIMYHQNPDDHLYFGLLADFKDSRSGEEPTDEMLEKKAYEGIEALNRLYGERFCLFIRQRRFHPADKIYMGWERKRGALIQLVRLCKGKQTDFRRIVASKELLSSLSYILTLDADTDLRMGAIKTMYSVMRHPENKPIIQNGVVVSGYGVIQPRMVTSVSSASRSPFALMHAGSGGFDSYRNALFDFYQSVYGRGTFCGKGMFDVDVFYRVIDQAFPEGQILSHDLLEGTRLRCGYLSELALTDSAPSTALSYFSRQHRWMRGDLQALPFAFPHVLSAEARIKNPIDKLSKFMIVSNVIRLLTPIFALAALFFSTLLQESTCAVFLFFSFAYLLFPLCLTVVRTFRHASRRFYSNVMQGVWQSICRTLFSFCSLAYDEQLAFDALIRVLYRKLFSGKKLLEWVTASEGEKKYKNASPLVLPALYFKKALPSSLIGTLMVIFSEGGPVRLIGLFAIVHPLIAFILSRPFLYKKDLKERQKKRLLRYAEDSFLFFERFVSEKTHHLPPDNYQELPVARLAERTSPTNIALYLTSCMAMWDLELRDRKEMLKRIKNTVHTLQALPKYKGHLYNWYDTRSLDLIGTPYISTVDSGNLALALLSLKNGLDNDAPAEKELIKRIEQLLNEMDFSFLYSEESGLLAIGYDPIEDKQSENCYDLLASEARSAYYYAIATHSIPTESWGALGRPITVSDGHMGLLSWSGTAFEYFMPVLFLPLEENTLLYEALCFALYEQQKDRTEGIWGRSESCYFAFDGMMNYQYRAFGSKSLALDPITVKHDVLAPYASFLTLCLSPSSALKNLKNIEELGAYGGYGFYEAIDFTPDRVGRGTAVIRSYMSHHVGMSITAIANAYNKNCFVKRTMKDPQMNAARELLLEHIPADARISKIYQISEKRPQRNSFSFSFSAPHKESWENALVYKGAFRILASDERKLSLLYDRYTLTPPCSSQGPFPEILVGTKEGHFDLLAERFSFNGAVLCYEKTRTEGKTCLKICPLKENGALFHLSFSPSSSEDPIQNSPKELLRFFFPLALSAESEFLTHPAYAGLSVESFFDEKNRILFFKKRCAGKEQPPLYLGFTMTSAFSFTATAVDEAVGEQPFTMAINQKTGPCRKPFALLECTVSKKERWQRDLILMAGSSANEVRGKLITFIKDPNARQEPLRFDKRYFIKKAGHTLPSKTLCLYVSMLLEGILKRRSSATDLPCYPINALWSYGISGDLPLFTFLLPREPLSESQKRVVSDLLRAHAYLHSGGIFFDMILLRTERESYFSMGKKELCALIDGVSGRGLMGRKGGVHLLFDREAQGILPSFSTVFLFIGHDCVFPSLKKAFLSCLEKEKQMPITRTSKKPYLQRSKALVTELPCGVFEKERFLPNPCRKPYAPYSYIYAGAQFGTLVTDRSLGFTWFRNSGECRLTPFSGSEDRGLCGERLILSCKSGAYDLAACADHVEFTRGFARYEGSVDLFDYHLYVGVDDRLPVKIVTLKILNRAPVNASLSLEYRLIPCLSKLPDGLVCEKNVGDTRFFKRSAGREFADFGMYLSEQNTHMTLSSGQQGCALFLFGSVNLKNDRCYYHVKSRFRTEEDAFSAYARYADEERAFCAPFTLDCPDLPLSLYLNGLLPHQIRKVRLFARTGFYQPGGAYGFRDQLQDALSLVMHHSDLLLRQIYRCAAHQYYAGDVQHWWHPLSYRQAENDAGIRTHCSDDLLWLPFATAVYLDHTGNYEVLDKRIAYLSSPPLKEGEERYERPEKTERKESLYHHLLRALHLAEQRRSGRGLCLMGSCDWNDGLSAVGGESVWLTQFFLLCLQKMTPYLKQEDKEHFSVLKKELSDALLAHCREDDRYLRAFFPCGTPLGSKDSPYCKIDLLPQAFAVFLDPTDLFAKKAINTAYELLFVKKHDLFRLFTPSYDRESPLPGYLADYCPGFRENGGQYTHAAVWGAMGLLLAGEHERGYQVIKGINPINLWMKKDAPYALEPYCLAGDVYYADGFEGRGGWSQYTGSAGWYLLALLNVLLGYREEKDSFSLAPRLCGDFPSFTLTVSKKQTVYTITAELSEKEELLLDGKPSKNRFFFDKGRHTVKMVLQKRKK